MADTKQSKGHQEPASEGATQTHTTRHGRKLTPKPSSIVLRAVSFHEWDGAGVANGELRDTHARPLIRLTHHLVACYGGLSPRFKYRPELKPRRVLTRPRSPHGNGGLDNRNSNLILSVDDVIHSEAHTLRSFRVLELLGQGTFGQVVCCEAAGSKQRVAVKVIKNNPAYTKQAHVEVRVLRLLNNLYDRDGSCHILRLLDSFTYKSHLCLVFELLSVNLYELMKQNHYRGLSCTLIRAFTSQLLKALECLAGAGVIHCDLKPENVLLEGMTSARIKLVDFGSACFETQPVFSYIQSRFYRSPEVLLGMRYNRAIDVWSLGCIAAELFLGLPLFPGQSQYDQIQRIVKMFGLPPKHMLSEGRKTKLFFNHDASTDEYSLKPVEQYCKERKVKEAPSKQYFQATTLEELVHTYPFRKSLTEDQIAKERNMRKTLIHFLGGLLQLDPRQRWTPAEARAHPFVKRRPPEELSAFDQQLRATREAKYSARPPSAPLPGQSPSTNPLPAGEAHHGAHSGSTTGMFIPPAATAHQMHQGHQHQHQHQPSPPGNAGHPAGTPTGRSRSLPHMFAVAPHTGPFYGPQHHVNGGPSQGGGSYGYVSPVRGRVPPSTPPGLPQPSQHVHQAQQMQQNMRGRVQPRVVGGPQVSPSAAVHAGQSLMSPTADADGFDSEKDGPESYQPPVATLVRARSDPTRPPSHPSATSAPPVPPASGIQHISTSGTVIHVRANRSRSGGSSGSASASHSHGSPNSGSGGGSGGHKPARRRSGPAAGPSGFTEPQTQGQNVQNQAGRSPHGPAHGPASAGQGHSQHERVHRLRNLSRTLPLPGPGGPGVHGAAKSSGRVQSPGAFRPMAGGKRLTPSPTQRPVLGGKTRSTGAIRSVDNEDEDGDVSGGSRPNSRNSSRGNSPSLAMMDRARGAAVGQGAGGQGQMTGPVRFTRLVPSSVSRRRSPSPASASATSLKSLRRKGPSPQGVGQGHIVVDPQYFQPPQHQDEKTLQQPAARGHNLAQRSRPIAIQRSAQAAPHHSHHTHNRGGGSMNNSPQEFADSDGYGYRQPVHSYRDNGSRWSAPQRHSWSGSGYGNQALPAPPQVWHGHGQAQPVQGWEQHEEDAGSSMWPHTPPFVAVGLGVGIGRSPRLGHSPLTRYAAPGPSRPGSGSGPSRPGSGSGSVSVSGSASGWSRSQGSGGAAGAVPPSDRPVLGGTPTDPNQEFQ